MLRRQQYSVQLGELEYVKPIDKKCVSRKERLAQQKKEACGVGVLKAYSVDEVGNSLTKNVGNMMDDARKLVNIYKQHACDPLAPKCLITKKCKAKTSTLHDGTSNVEPSIIGLNIKGDGNVGALYNTYRDIKIVDTEALIQQIRQGYAPFQDQVTKEALYKSQQYGAQFDVMTGVPTGFGCPSACPPRKKVCHKYPPTCKIQDPLNNPIIGIGSDGMEARENLRDVIEATASLNGLRVAPQTASSQTEDSMRVKTDLPAEEMEEELNEYNLLMEARRQGKGEMKEFSPKETPPSEAGASDLTVKAGETTGDALLRSRNRVQELAQIYSTPRPTADSTIALKNSYDQKTYGRILTNNERTALKEGRIPRTVQDSLDKMGGK